MKLGGGVIGAWFLSRVLAARPWHGVWWDLGERETLEHADVLVGRLQALGLNEVCVQLNYVDVPPTFRSNDYSADGLLRWAEKLRRGGIRVSVGPWCRPTQAYVDSVVESPLLRRIVSSGLFWSLEYDAEEPWIRSAAAGFGDRNEAGIALDHATRSVLGRKMQLGCNAPPEYIRHVGELARRADYFCPQAYSQAERRSDGRIEPAYDIDGRYGPGAMQRLAVTRVKDLGGPKLAMGLAAYKQDFDRISGLEAMNIAYKAAIDAKPIGVRWWSAKFVVRASSPTRHPTQAAFFRAAPFAPR
jgi:hypothetical protein